MRPHPSIALRRNLRAGIPRLLYWLPDPVMPAASMLFATLQARWHDTQTAAESSEHAVAIFIVAIGLMLLVGRLLGELMQRIGQPAVMGQLLAGVVIGQSVLGALWPSTYQQLFAGGTRQRD